LGIAGHAAANPEGLITKASKYPVAEAADRLDKVLTGAGMTVFAVIDHAAAAQKAGLRMPASRVIVFGNPKGGTPMMLNAPTIAIDLPLKILLWEDSAGKAWVSYNAANYITGRHQLKDMEKMVQGLEKALAKLTAGVVE
jgi:uncharacterized protein (DUF302 family)